MIKHTHIMAIPMAHPLPKAALAINKASAVLKIFALALAVKMDDACPNCSHV